MLILGLAGGLNRPWHRRFDLPFILHDAAAVLVEDGQILAAVEEERLNRIKHSNCFPERAILACLEIAGATPADLDGIAFSFTEPFLDYQLRHYFLERQQATEFSGIRCELESLLREVLGDAPAIRDLTFIDHHLAHAASAYLPSRFDEALVAVVDGQGDNVSVSLYDGCGGELERLTSLPVTSSLGMFYLAVIHTIGFRLFDEFKAMALAPYGRPEAFRDLFDMFAEVQPNGCYELAAGRAEAVLGEHMARTAADRRESARNDIAAALQERLETLLLHLLGYWGGRTQRRALCLAGGVAHNCAANGHLLREGPFERLFVQPAAHDAGAALGAALVQLRQLVPRQGIERMRHVHLGRVLPEPSELQTRLEAWSDLIEIERLADPEGAAAGLLAGGCVIGWVQGRAEFGPRALGNRSILADPRPHAQRDRINGIVKKRESFRPFAPAVLAERAHEFFEIGPNATELPFMTVCVPVAQEWRSRLGAVTHVDGSARIQAVSAEAYPRFHALIRKFGDLTGVPILLNTSFNNHVEPIVDSADDAVACFLTTGLDHLVIGDFLVLRGSGALGAFDRLRFSTPAHVAVELRLPREHATPPRRTATVRRLYGDTTPRPISGEMWRLLADTDASLPLGARLEAAGLNAKDADEVRREVRDLFSERYLEARPLGT